MVGDGVQLERVRAELAEARQWIAALEAADVERDWVAHALRERVKELHCLYGISHLVEEPDISLREILQGTADLIPFAWQYPEIAAARIVLDGEQYSTESYTEDAGWVQGAEIKVHGRQSGVVEVCYLQEMPESDEGPFLQEERDLIDAIAERLGRVIERRRMEQALRESEERLRAVTELVSDWAYASRIDADGSVELEWITLAFAQFTGFTPEEHGSVDQWRSAIHPQDLPVFERRMQALYAGREDTSVYRVRDGAGQWRWMRDYGLPVWDEEQGRVVRIYGAAQDITASMRAEETLRESEERFRIVSELTSDGAYALRIKPSGAIEVEWMTDAFTRVTGLTQAEFDSIERWLGMIHPQDLPVFEQRIRAILSGREDISEYRVRSEDDGWRWVRDYGRPVWDETQDRVVRVFGAIQDITARARAGEALRRARDELEQRVQERTAALEQGRQRESVLNAVLRLSMQEASLDEQLVRALDEILAIPWLPVLRQGAIFVTDGAGNLRLHAHRGLSPAFEVACARVDLGHCLCGRAAVSGTIEFADCIDERHEIHYQGMPPHGHYCVPILSATSLAAADPSAAHRAKASVPPGGTVSGVLVLYLQEGHQRDPQEQAFLQALAHTLAGMIERAHAEDALRQNEGRLRRLNAQLQEYSRTLERRVTERTQEIERRRQVAESLRDILTVLNSDRPLDEALEYIVSEASRLLGGDASATYRQQDPDEGFRVQTAVGRSAQWMDHAVLPAPLAQRLRQGQPVAFSNTPIETLEGDSPDFSQLPPPGCMIQGCQALLAVPLVIAGEIYGALVLYYAQPRAFDEEEVSLAVVFADQAALAIENARLHQRAAEAAVVQERARLARELHDSVTQSLYSLTLLAEGWRRLEAAGRLEDADDPLTELGEIAQQALKEMRLMVYELRPPALEQEGLLGALHVRLGAVEQRAGVEARLLAQEIVDLPAPIEEGLYRIAIEALNNALKHASATAVTVHVRADAGRVVLEVVDDGVGFDVALNAHSPGMGLRTMRERAEELGGTLAIHSAPGKGTSIVVRVPVAGGPVEQ